MIKDTSNQDVITSNNSGKRSVTYLSVGLIIIIGIAVISYSFTNAMDGAEMSVNRQTLTLANVTKGDFVKDISAQGKVVAAASPTLYARESGTVTLKVKAGDSVEIGDMLAEIDSPDLTSELAREKASLQSLLVEIARMKIEQKKTALTYQQQIEVSELELQASEREMRRAEKSIKVEAISIIDYEKAIDLLKKTKVDFNHIRQQASLSEEIVQFELQTNILQQQRQSILIEELERRVESLNVRSTVSGVVGSLIVEQKANVERHAPLLSVVDLRMLEVEIKVPENYASDLAVGMSVDLNLNKKHFEGEIAAISPEVKDNQVVSRVKFSGVLPKSIRQNQRLTTRILLEEKKDVIKVQRGNFLENGSYSVYVVEGDLARRRSVSMGSKSVREVEITAGLKPGETIVISNTNKFLNAEAVILR